MDKLDELSENRVEELRVLQTVIVLLTTSSVIQRDALAKV